MRNGILRLPASVSNRCSESLTCISGRSSSWEGAPAEPPVRRTRRTRAQDRGKRSPDPPQTSAGPARDRVRDRVPGPAQDLRRAPRIRQSRRTRCPRPSRDLAGSLNGPTRTATDSPDHDPNGPNPPRTRRTAPDHENYRQKAAGPAQDPPRTTKPFSRTRRTPDPAPGPAGPMFPGPAPDPTHISRTRRTPPDLAGHRGPRTRDGAAGVRVKRA